MASSHGQKVTTDPASKQPIHEGVGVVTSDSLAAESLQGSGHFAEGNVHAGVSKQPSKSTTTNNTDTSSATKLNPAPDAEAREAQEGWTENAQLNAGRGLGKTEGVGPTYASIGAGSESTGTSYQGGSHGGSSVPTAPTGSYAGSATTAGDLKPKGKNLTEGGFSSDDPNASFNQEIGTEKDPGRRAEQSYQLRDAQSAAEGGGGPRQKELTGKGVYDTLKSDENA